MAVEKLLTKIAIGTETDLTLTSSRHVYAIASKDAKKTKAINIDSDIVKRINFSVLIESGVTNKPIQVDSFSIEFSSDKQDDRTIAYTDVTRLPSECIIKPVALYTYDDKKLTEGETNIALNFNVQ